MMQDWSVYRKQLASRVGGIAKLSPDTLRGEQLLAGAGQKADHLGAKTRELIALAVAEAAVKHGATREEVAEALGVAVALNAGAALVYSARALDAVEASYVA
jgi:alkylhydroperoxidase/carboxymuconolactone decarboxylase family protein YurZ